jgi:hypothetical protein
LMRQTAEWPAHVISQFLRDEPFFPPCIIGRKLSTSPHTIKDIAAGDLGIRKFTRRWVPHEGTPPNKTERVEDARTLLQAIGSDSEKHLVHLMTDDES